MQNAGRAVTPVRRSRADPPSGIRSGPGRRCTTRWPERDPCRYNRLNGAVGFSGRGQVLPPRSPPIMKLEVLNVNIVVTAAHHNPSILHPTFLTTQGIVPEDWQTVGAVICTPPLSIARYQNGIGFTAEPEKFQVVDQRPGDAPANSRVTILASKYIEKLPHVRYTGVGANIKGFVETSSADSYLVERFLKSGPWRQPPLAFQAVGIKLMFGVDGGRLVLALDPGVVASSTGPGRSGIVIDANYHTDISEGSSVAVVTDAIGRFPRYCSEFPSTASGVLGI